MDDPGFGDSWWFLMDYWSASWKGGHAYPQIGKGHFGIEKTRELIARKYYWATLWQDVEAYVKGCDVCLTSKAVHHKLYGDLQSLPVPTHRWKDLSIDFVTGLLILADWKIHDRCTRSSKSDHRCGRMPPRSSGVNCHGLRSAMKAYLRAFVNWEQKDWARLLLIAEFAYSAKATSTGHTPLEILLC